MTTAYGTSLRIAVLAGGVSAEREISLRSGAAAAKALDDCGHRVQLIDPALTDLEQLAWVTFDLAFVALHGPFGEDGELQRLLDRLGVPYTGSDATASALAFSKSAAKERLLQSGIPTPAYVLISDRDPSSRIVRQAERLGYPLAVKPDSQGSSVGVSLIENADALESAVQTAFEYDESILLERAISGEEWTVSLLDDRPLPPIRVVPANGFYDFASKYEDDRTQYLFEHNHPESVVEQMIEIASKACAALGTRGLARADLMLDADGTPWILEVNTIPGLTDHSLAPKAAARVGISFPELCDRMARGAFEKRARLRHTA